jgi:hypothetical protein
VRFTEIKLEPIFFWRTKLDDGWIGPDGFDNNVAPAVSIFSWRRVRSAG